MTGRRQTITKAYHVLTIVEFELVIPCWRNRHSIHMCAIGRLKIDDKGLDDTLLLSKFILLHDVTIL